MGRGRSHQQIGAAARQLIESRTATVVETAQAQALGQPTERSGDRTVGQTRMVNVTTDQSAAVAVEQITVTTTSKTKVNVSATPAKLPETVPSPPPTPIQVLNITVEEETAQNVTGGTLQLQVNRSAIGSASPESLVVYRYHDGSWQSLQTNVQSTTETTVTLTAQTPVFSYFAIGVASDSGGTTKVESSSETTAETTQTQTQAQSPGFGILGAVSALLLMVVIRLRR